MVVPHPRAGSHALLTRAPLSPGASPGTSFDLHVLGLPPAFVLSQDQTLKLSLRPVHFSPGGRNHPGVTDYLHGPLFQKKERPVQASRQRCTETDRFRHPNKDSYPICRDAKNAARASLPLPQCQTARRQNRRNQLTRRPCAIHPPKQAGRPRFRDAPSGGGGVIRITASPVKPLLSLFCNCGRAATAPRIAPCS